MVRSALFAHVSNHEAKALRRGWLRGPHPSRRAARAALLRMRDDGCYSASFSAALAVNIRSSSRNIFSAFETVSNTIVVRSGTWVLCEHANFGGRCAEDDQRQQVIHQEFRAGPRALDHLQQQQHDAERKQEVGERDRPGLARDHRHLEQHVREGHAGHQEGDDIVHRERNQEQRETDHRQIAFSIKMSRQDNAAAKHWLRRRHCHISWVGRNQAGEIILPGERS